MAEKRSNKTARVLNLITQKKDEEPKEKAEEHVAAKAAPAESSAAQIEEKQSESEAVQQRPARRRTTKSPSRPRASTAKKKVEESLPLDEAEEADIFEEEEYEPPETVPAPPVVPAAPPPVVVPIVQNAKDHEIALSDEIRSGLLSALEAEEKPTEPEKEEADEEEQAAEGDEEKKKKVHFIEKDDRAEEMVATPHGEQHVQYINVMQELVEENELYYLNMLQCTCPRCIADMKALALTNLPSKYVVMDQDKKKITMSFYASRYESILSVQMMRACVMVSENPHH